jgi:hypothetical protein
MNGTRFTASTAEQITEFVALLAELDVHVQARAGWQKAKCWNKAGHANGDRTPSMSVNVTTCGWRCHACGIRGGLTGLRRQCGRTAPNGTSRPNVKALTARLARLAAPNADVVAEIPLEAVERLQERTGRHRRRHVLNRNLQALLAGIVTAMRDNGSTRRVRFTATDALRHGIRAETWHDLLEMLPYLGLNVNRGQSGRYLAGARRGRGKDGRLLATTLTLTKTEYPLAAEQTHHYSQQSGVFRNGTHVTLASSVAVRAPLPKDETPSLNRRPAVARLVMTLALHESEAPATGNQGWTHRPRQMALDELVKLYGNGIRKVVRRAERDGLVHRQRLQADDFTLDVVQLTDTGSMVAERDEIAGTLHLSALAHKAEQRLQDFQERLQEAERRHRERHEQAPWQWPTEAKYVRTDDGRLLDIETGVLANV